MTESRAPTVVEHIEVRGVVQGVGFRPFVARVARSLGVTGTVANDRSSVFIHAAGRREQLDDLVSRLERDAPPLARVTTIERTGGEPGEAPSSPGFHIVGSGTGTGPPSLLPVDSALCGACHGELLDPDDRRYRHPFINCTDCGPRFTITTALPYDRHHTTMGPFPMCDRCAAEYQDPDDRRHHAQPVCCPDCGPQLDWRTPGDSADHRCGEAALAAAVSALLAGRVVALKGLGGFHLACDARNGEAVAEIRRRKDRRHKPLAVMVADLEAAARYVEIDEPAIRELASPTHPVILLPARRPSDLSPLVSPDNPDLGVMLPYTGVHHLLFADGAPPLVMTSANLGGEPILYEDGEVSRARLDQISDGVLSHDRRIHVSADDPVVRTVGGRVTPIRSGRGTVPAPVSRRGGGPDVLAVGGDHRNTFCLGSGEWYWVSQHTGDLTHPRTHDALGINVSRMCELYGIEPRVVAVDAHPGYLSAEWGRRWIGGSADPPAIVEVQHHHAHLCSVLAESGLGTREPILGFVFDGTGYGDDGAIWGGEVLWGSAEGYRRVAHLDYVGLPGGDAAVRSPVRSALAHLAAAGLDWSRDLPPVRHLADEELDLVGRQLAMHGVCPPTSSMGRLFDAVASLLGLCHEITFEAQAAVLLEAAARSCGPPPSTLRYRFGVTSSPDGGPPWRLDARPVIAAVVDDLGAGRPARNIAADFHAAVVGLVVDVATRWVALGHPPQVALSGGAFQNALLASWCVDRLRRAGIEPYTHRVVPPNDGGLSLGQACVATVRATEHRMAG